MKITVAVEQGSELDLEKVKRQYGFTAENPTLTRAGVVVDFYELEVE